MKSTSFAPIALMFLVGCAPLGLPGSLQLFAESSTTNGQIGQAALISTTADIDCDAFTDGLVNADLWDDLEEDQGVVFTLAYSYPSSETGDWVGFFAPGGGIPMEVEGQDTNAARTGYAMWFDTGYWWTDNSGLLVEITEFSSDGVVGRVDSVNGSGRVSAENCGSF